MTVEFYPNKITGTAPLCTWATDRRMTIEEWIKSQAPSYAQRESPPLSVVLNGEIIPQEEWALTVFRPKDIVMIFREPKGTDPFSITFALFTGVKAVFKSLMPKMPGMPSNTGLNDGDPISAASAKGNKAKLGDPIRQIAGRQRTYPSYLSQPVSSYFGPRDQRVRMLLYVGEGEYEIPLTSIKVGETPVISLGSDADIKIYPPGADLSGDPAHILYYAAPEVGASSSGSAGLELTVASDLTRTASASAFEFNGDAISIPAGSGEFPSDWESGLIIRALAPYQYSVIDGGDDRDIVRGPLGMLNPTPGMLIEVTGYNAGEYVVHSYTPYSPAVPANPGSASTLTGSAAPTRYDFDVTPLTFTVNVDSTAYPVTLDAAATDLAGLVSMLNAKLSGGKLQTVAQSGRVRFVEQSPYSGSAITISAASTIVGTAPVSVVGAKTTSGSPEQPAEMTLDYDGGSPVVGLAIGTGMSSVGPRGLRFRITAFSATIMTVDRLLASGAVDAGFPGFDDMQTVSGVITLDPSNFEGGYRGPFACCPENEKITAIEYSVLYQNGLCGIGREGQIYEMSGNFRFEYRDMDVAGAWTTFDETVYAGSLDAQGFTRRVELPYPMRAEARIRKRYVDRPGRANDEARDDATWTDLRGQFESSLTSYPGLTVMTCLIRGGDRLSAQSESLVSCVPTRILKLMDGTTGPSRDIVPWCLHQLRERGYVDSDLDMAEWQAFHDICVSRGDTYDETLDSTITVKDMVNNALACGYGELVTFNGLLRPVRDSKRDAFDIVYGPKTQTYSPQNMTKLLKISGPMPSINDFTGVDIQYLSSKTWAWETVKCRRPGDDDTKVESLKVGGFSEEARAWRFGMRRRGHQKFRQDEYSWETELSGRNSGYLSFAAVSGDEVKRCQSSYLTAIDVQPSQTILYVADILRFSGAPDLLVGVRRRDGTLSGPWPAERLDNYSIRVDALDFTPEVMGPYEPVHVLFGPSDKWAYGVLVTSSGSSGANTPLVGMPYSDEVYTYDDLFPS